MKQSKILLHQYNHPFEPILFRDTKILILGTFPSLDSFKYDFYYAHKRNQFWKILSEIFDMPIDTNRQKISLLKKQNIGLWDIIKSCQRENSSDTNLKNCILHDIPLLLKEYPNIKTIAFTGLKAEKFYNKKYKNLPIKTIALPSPSPAFASMSYLQKKEIYENNIDIAIHMGSSSHR